MARTRPSPGSFASRVSGSWCQALIVAGVGLLAGLKVVAQAGPAALEPSEPPRKPFLFAFTQRMFNQVNENDAQASVKAWALAISRERSIKLEARPTIFADAAQLDEALREGRIDGGAALTPEFLELDPKTVDQDLFISIVGGKIQEEYLVLVRNDSEYHEIAQLQGKELLVHANPRMSLASDWLAGYLARNGAPAPDRHFARVTPTTRISQVVLPVFFGQRDVCLVTRNGFDSICELNPQVRHRVRILATSPPLVPAVGFFRAGLPAEQRAEMIRAMRHLEESASGRQVLTLFQTSGLVETNAEALRTAREILETAAGK